MEHARLGVRYNKAQKVELPERPPSNAVVIPSFSGGFQPLLDEPLFHAVDLALTDPKNVSHPCPRGPVGIGVNLVTVKQHQRIDHISLPMRTLVRYLFQPLSRIPFPCHLVAFHMLIVTIAINDEKLP
jgi:hypothetical protein